MELKLILQMIRRWAWLLTCGLWLVVWLIHVSMQKAPSLHVVRVDEYGAVWFDGTVWWPPPAGDGPQQVPPAHT